MDSTDARLSKLENETSTLSQSVRSLEELTHKQFLDLSISLESKDEKMKTILGKLDELDSQVGTYWGETKGELKELKGAKTAESTAKEPCIATGRLRGTVQASLRCFFPEGSLPGRNTSFLRVRAGLPDTPLIPNALYWEGESYMNLKDQEKAIVNFQEVITKYPKSEKAPRALLRQAEAYGGLGDKKSSTILLKRVIELYPKSDEAPIGERLLRNLGVQ